MNAGAKMKQTNQCDTEGCPQCYRKWIRTQRGLKVFWAIEHWCGRYRAASSLLSSGLSCSIGNVFECVIEGSILTGISDFKVRDKQTLSVTSVEQEVSAVTLLLLLVWGNADDIPPSRLRTSKNSLLQVVKIPRCGEMCPLFLPVPNLRRW